MKGIFYLILLIASTTANAQYSGYYRVDKNVNSDVNVSGNLNVNKNISTIDYGKLALANAENEKTRLANLKYADAKEKQIVLEIAEDPNKAFDYGYQYQDTFEFGRSDAKQYGFKKFTMSYRVPHNSLFDITSEGMIQNISKSNITSDITINGPDYNMDNKTIDVEQLAKLEHFVVAGVSQWYNDKWYIHKKEINRATVCGHRGFKTTIIWESDYEYRITDLYIAFDETQKNGVIFSSEVNTYGSKNEVNFEELEGRRYYFRQLMDRIVSTAEVGEIKF